MATMTQLRRLARLEAATAAETMPMHIEYHRVVSVRSDDHRRGSCVVQGSEVTFYAASAGEYEEASNSYANDRHIILIMVDARCIEFTH